MLSPPSVTSDIASTCAPGLWLNPGMALPSVSQTRTVWLPAFLRLRESSSCDPLVDERQHPIPLPCPPSEHRRPCPIRPEQSENGQRARMDCRKAWWPNQLELRCATRRA